MSCRALTTNEIELVLSNFTGRMKQRDQTIFLCGIRWGLRISDILKMKVGDFFHSHKVLDEITITEKKTGKKRRLFISSVLKDNLMEWIKELDAKGFLYPEGWMFPKSNGTRLNYHAYYSAFKSAVRRSGIPAPPFKMATHCMRKTFSRGFLKTAKDAGLTPHEALLELKFQLNHSTVETTMEYVEAKMERGNQLAKIWGARAVHEIEL